MSPLQRFLTTFATLGLAFLAIPNDGAAFADGDDDLPPAKFSVETSGPVHEAFAQPNEGKPVLNMAVQKEPPPALPERPPEQRPDNPNLEWIPGYWSWDAERNDFVWVSGTFRDPPPGRRWVPGHWSNGDQGWNWVPGFWANENQPDLKYTPEPPAPLEDGPSLPAPDANSGYVPGYWYYNDGDQRFAWRPGYYAPYRDGRVWVSPQYYWTPRGYVFVDGYWDYPLANRGMLFAPAYFPTPLWNDPNWYYQPSYVVPIGLFFNSGFYGPGYGSFYFGNYYGRNGYRPWWGGPRNNLYNYYAWNNRGNPQWAAQQHQNFANRLNGVAARPPANLAQQRAQFAANGANSGQGVTPLNRFTPANGKIVANNTIAANNLQAQNVRNLATMRAGIEGAKGAGATQPASLRLPPSPPVVRPLGAPSSASLAGISNPYAAPSRAFSTMSPNSNLGATKPIQSSGQSALRAPGAVPHVNVPGPTPNFSPAPRIGAPTHPQGSVVGAPQTNVPRAANAPNLQQPFVPRQTPAPQAANIPVAPRQSSVPQSIPRAAPAPQFVPRAAPPAMPQSIPRAAPQSIPRAAMPSASPQRSFSAPAVNRPSGGGFSGAGGARIGGGGGGGGKGGGRR